MQQTEKRERMLRFIEDVRLRVGASSVSTLASEAGLAASTLNRFVRDDSYQGLRIETLDKLAQHAGYESYGHYCHSPNSVAKTTHTDGLLNEEIYALAVESTKIIVAHRKYSPEKYFDVLKDCYNIGMDELAKRDKGPSVGDVTLLWSEDSVTNSARTAGHSRKND